MNLEASELASLCNISPQTEKDDEKGSGWGLQEERWRCLIGSAVPLPPLRWALGFNSAAPVCSGIPLLPWRSRTYSHSGGILLSLCPANTQRRPHVHRQRRACFSSNACMSNHRAANIERGAKQRLVMYAHMQMHITTRWQSPCTHLLFTMCKHEGA